MYKYNIYGVIFEFDIKMPECKEVDDDVPATYCVKGADLKELIRDIEERRISGKEMTNEKGELPSRYIKCENGTIFSYIVDVGIFKSTEAKLLEYHPVTNTDDVVFRQWLLAYGITVAQIQLHNIILHGAGLLVPGTDKGIVVCGESGAGKSTISNALLEKGLLFVADDSVRVDTDGNSSVVYGSNKQRRLCLDVAERGAYDTSSMIKYRSGMVEKWIKNMGEEYYGDVPRRLINLFVLAKKDSDRVEVEEVTGADKIKVLMSQLYKVSVYVEQGIDGLMFMKFANIAKNIRVYKVYRPEAGMTIDEITKRIYKIATE